MTQSERIDEFYKTAKEMGLVVRYTKQDATEPSIREFTVADATRIIKGEDEKMEKALLAKETVQLPFGVISVVPRKERAERPGINPRTKEEIIISAIPAHDVLKISMRKNFKEKLNPHMAE